ncbi:MAG: dienelactone hydrolase family protein [Kiloniellales bacterium]|nr:dienelactone hydrolase family protein [Kiloniellales bacterium]
MSDDVRGRMIELTAGDGHRLSAYRARPAGVPKAGLVIVQEIFGVNRHIRAVTEGFARDGYMAVAPALFDRRERGLELGYEAEDVAHGRELKAATSWEEAAEDTAAAIAVAAEAGKVGVVGYCWGGSIAWLAACRLPVAAAVGYYGGQVRELSGETPRCPVMLHFGEQDSAIPLEDVEAVRSRHPKVPIHLYPAGHGFNCDLRGSYHAESAALAQERSLAFLAEHLG